MAWRWTFAATAGLRRRRIDRHGNRVTRPARTDPRSRTNNGRVGSGAARRTDPGSPSCSDPLEEPLINKQWRWPQRSPPTWLTTRRAAGTSTSLTCRTAPGGWGSANRPRPRRCQGGGPAHCQPHRLRRGSAPLWSAWIQGILSIPRICLAPIVLTRRRSCMTTSFSVLRARARVQTPGNGPRFR